MSEKLLTVADAIRDQRYPDCLVAFAAGSLLRGEGTAYSDLDLVVIYRNVSNAYREAFRVQGLPVEAFVHDPETLNYFFFDVDRPSGIPALAQMVVEGVEIPVSTDFSRSLKEQAASVLAMGPPSLSESEIDRLRYAVTGLLDDLREPRSRDELISSGSQLFEALADYYLRSKGRWSAKGKAIPRALAVVDAGVCSRYCQGFVELFKGDAASVIALAEDILKDRGGLLFEGYRDDAPRDWRKVIV